MIKKNNKNKAKYKDNKTTIQIIVEYLRTIFIAFCVAIIVTTILTIHARNQMIKNLYVDPVERKRTDEIIAQQIVNESNITKDLASKKYSICMYAGQLYETIQDYPNAELAYYIALEKYRGYSYTPHLRYVSVLIAQSKFKECQEFLDSIIDVPNKQLIKFKTRAYIELGDKYFADSKFLKATRAYEKSKYYYDKFTKKDKIIEASINNRIALAYIEAANVMVQYGYNSEAVRFLKKSKIYKPNDFEVQYKLAIVYADLDPLESVKYFEQLSKKCPQYIDYGLYSKVLLKAANIAEIQGDSTKSKYYRYKVHSLDLLIGNKVIYKNDLEITLDSLVIKKIWFKYKLKTNFSIKNISNNNINRLYADFVLKHNDKVLDTITKELVTPSNPLYMDCEINNVPEVVFENNIYTKKQMEEYHIEVYAYKDKKYKTLICKMRIPQKNYSYK